MSVSGKSRPIGDIRLLAARRGRADAETRPTLHLSHASFQTGYSITQGSRVAASTQLFIAGNAIIIST